MSDNSRHEEIRRFGNAFLTFIGTIAIIVPESNSPADVKFSGTASFISTGAANLIVTSGHVWSFFQEMKAEHSETKLVLLPGPGADAIDLSNETPTAYLESPVDICAFKLEPTPNLAAVQKAFFPCKVWPPERAKVGDLVIGIGFPGSERVIGDQSLVMVAAIISDEVSSCSERHFVVADEEGQRRWEFLRPGRETLELPGTSGCPFFTITENAEETNFQLAGFMYEAYNVHQDNDDLRSSVYVIHADFLLESGTIDAGKLF